MNESDQNYSIRAIRVTLSLQVGCGCASVNAAFNFTK